MNADANPAKAIFLEAVEQHDPDQWPAFLDRACAGRPELRGRVEVLLQAHREAGTGGHQPGAHEAAPGPAATAGEPITERPGTVIRPYRLLEQIGEGGFGVVFMAEQQEPVRRKVALKVLKPGMDSRQVVARFEAERQALALMDHPHIAKVLDGGQTASGRPYFVMDLVKGLPITDYCDQHLLTPRERLELFVHVCQAVQHAHQKGVIHRDLKPSNVLVTVQDGAPLVKVIDFGIAKALGQQLTDKTLFTGFAQLLGTPLYMSPEQAALSNVDVDTRSDVYSLGVLLYELLTGTTPFDKERFRGAGYDELRRIIREEEPPRPSTRLSTLGPAATAVSSQRKTDPRRLSQLCRGELDWMVMKALDKDRSRRYETASAFAADVQRYLNDEPVLACPPSASYRLRKFMRRNRKLLVTAVAFLVLLGFGIIGLVIGLIEVGQERDQKDQALQAETTARRAEKQARTLAMKALLQISDEVVQQQLARRTALTEEDRRFLRNIQRGFAEFAALPGEEADQRAIRALGHLHVAAVRAGLGEEKEAEASFREALALYGKLAADFPAEHEFRHELARSHNQLGSLLQETGRPKEAEKAFADALALRKQLAADVPGNVTYREELATTHYNSGKVYQHAGRLEEARKAYAEAVAIQKQLAAEFPTQPAYRREWALSLFNSAILFQTKGKLPEAEGAYAEARALQKKLVGEFPGRIEFRQDLAASHHNLGLFLQITGRLPEAEKSYGDALAIWKQLAADYPIRSEYRQELARTHNNLGVLFKGTRRPQEAEKAFTNALALRKQLASDSPTRPEYRHDLAESYHNLGFLLQATGKLREAEKAYTDALTIIKQLVADFRGHPTFLHSLARSHNNLAGLYFNAGRLKEAEGAFAEVLVLSKQLVANFPGVPEYQKNIARALGNLALVANSRGDYPAARRWLDQASPYHQAALNANPNEPECRRSYQNYLFTLVKSCAGTGDHTAALHAAEKLRDLGWDPPATAYDAGCALALCVAIVGQVDRGTKEDRAKQARFYSDKAMAMLRDAVARGFRNGRHMKEDPDLISLRAREDFQMLLAELKGKVKE
jgi:serine/threonine protein kinase/tetratricopeptide (TPR) repeat protein